MIWVPDQQGPKQVSTGTQITAVYSKLTWGPIKRGPKQCTTGFPITVSPSYSAVMWVPDQQGPKRVSAGAHIRAVYDELIWDSLGTCSELMSFPYTQSLAVARRQGALKKCAHDSPRSDLDRGESRAHIFREPCQDVFFFCQDPAKHTVVEYGSRNSLAAPFSLAMLFFTGYSVQRKLESVCTE